MTRRRSKHRLDPKRAVTYLRASTNEQQLGPEAQLAAIERWAEAEGVTLVAVHRDLGVSGGAEIVERPGLQRALAYLHDEFRLATGNTPRVVVP